MPEYHKNVKQSNEKSDKQGFIIQQLTMLDIQKAVKGRFTSFCTAVGIQALMTMMEQDVEAVAGPKGKHNPGSNCLPSWLPKHYCSLGQSTFGH